MGKQWENGGFMGNPWENGGCSMLFMGFSGGSSWDFSGFPLWSWLLQFLPLKIGTSMEPIKNLWEIYGKSMGNLWETGTLW